MELAGWTLLGALDLVSCRRQAAARRPHSTREDGAIDVPQLPLKSAQRVADEVASEIAARAAKAAIAATKEEMRKFAATTAVNHLSPEANAARGHGLLLVLQKKLKSSTWDVSRYSGAPLLTEGEQEELRLRVQSRPLLRAQLIGFLAPFIARCLPRPNADAEDVVPIDPCPAVLVHSSHW